MGVRGGLLCDLTLNSFGYEAQRTQIDLRGGGGNHTSRRGDGKLKIPELQRFPGGRRD